MASRDEGGVVRVPEAWTLLSSHPLHPHPSWALRAVGLGCAQWPQPLSDPITGMASVRPSTWTPKCLWRRRDRSTLGLCTPGPDFAVLGPASASHLVGHTCSPPGPVPRKEVHDVRRASSSLFIAAHWTWSGSAWMAAGRAPRVPRGPPQLVLMPPWALRGI